MTPEQNEQWRRTILPLTDHLTGDEWVAERAMVALLPAKERVRRFIFIFGEVQLANWDVPSWAREMRLAILIWRLDHVTEPWAMRFALRSVAALTGIQITTPGEAEQVLMFQRIFARFAQEVLRPFVEWVRQMQIGEARRDNYKPIMTLYDAYEGFIPPAGEEPWFSLYVNLSGMDEQGNRSEMHDCLRLAQVLLGNTLIQFNLVHLFSTDPPTWNPYSITYAINRQHQCRLMTNEGDLYDDGPDYTEPIAQAFLTALEAECPPPDWLPRI
ncbi:MAG: hypothetical protein QM758_07400 [Armatimonas sp.]